MQKKLFLIDGMAIVYRAYFGLIRNPRINSKGENVSAKEVEDLLYGHPKVGDVAVIGLPDAASGERVCAIVQTTEGSAPIAFDEMMDFLVEAGLMRQKLPEQLELLEVLPRNPAGKVLKHELRARYADSGSQ